MDHIMNLNKYISLTVDFRKEVKYYSYAITIRTGIV